MGINWRSFRRTPRAGPGATLLESFYRDLAWLRIERDEQFRRAERLLRSAMHPEERALDTAAGNDPDRVH